ncbi:MAG: serine/threonine-protein phosphatase [Oscillospiraceae bacterium]|nr:serine/threonine-protein phosphatase [Oscillospiraceae bacterium]
MFQTRPYLCLDIGSASVNHAGEELCGDHVEVISDSEQSAVVVLADGMGSGVKACILSTLTSKILSTMMHAGLPIETCVETIAATLPVCSMRGIAYSTFTLISVKDSEFAEIYQYDNPPVTLLRGGTRCELTTEEITIGDKRIMKSRARLMENDVLLAMSDGCPHAGIGVTYNFGWKMENIIEFMEPVSAAGYTAKTISTLLVDAVNSLYGGKPGDDATVCSMRVRRRAPMNVLFGPAANRCDDDQMMPLFFSKEGKHIICGGATASIAAAYLGKRLTPSLDFIDPEIPPIATLDGADLVTEGVITMNRVLTYAKDHISSNELHSRWDVKRDGASMICRMLFEEATDINFYVGKAINPAHQNPELPINFSIKMQLVAELSECLRKMGKRVKVSYF